MRITSIRVDRLAVPLQRPYHLSQEYGTFSTATPVLVTMETDEGVTGYGECDPWPLFTGDSAELSMLLLRQHLGPMLIGRDPTNLNELHRIMDATIRGQHLTKSALDMAAYDILGKRSGLPVHQILGGKRRDQLRCMWSIGGSTPEESAREVLEAKEAGYDGCMIKIGGPDWRLDAARTRAVRDAVGRRFPLIADANQGWDADTALRYGREVRDCDLIFFEQPLQSWDVDGMAKLHRKLPMPLSADEGVMTLQDAVRLVRADAVDVFSIKVTKNGGIHPAKAICDYAAASGIQVFFNSMIEEGITQAASLQLGAVCGSLVSSIGHAYFSPNRLQSDISDFHRLIHPKDGYVQVPDGPGLGVAPDWGAIKIYTVATEIITESNHI
ncbi:MAG: enolase C-terminal domain-like protein [Oscillospiraceae bacterium]|nr:enolase C-terminal domain-like protein [Oscillospiraceae bacterium]